MQNEKCINEGCDLTHAANIVGGRWKLLILGKLEQGKLRFGEIKKQIPSITERILTLQLRELENDGFVKRTVYAEVPSRVDYALTKIANELVPIWVQLSDWGAKHRKMISILPLKETV